MSISSVAEVAFVRRTDVNLPQLPTTSKAATAFDKIELVTSGTPNAQTALSTTLKVIVTYIPTEVLTLYVAVLAAIRVPSRTDVRPLRIAFYGFLVATPLVVWLVYAAKCKGGGKGLPLTPRTWPLWEMLAAALAYAAWALALSDNPFSNWYSPGLSAIVVLVVSTLLGLVAPIFQRPIKA
jgi:hypothetical protein